MMLDGKPFRFYFRGGNLALDFVNTVGDRLSKTGQRDYLRSSDLLLRWAREAGLSLPNKNDNAGVSSKDLRKAIAFRESLYGLLVRQMEGKAAAPEDLRNLNELLMKQRSRMHLEQRQGGYKWRSEPTSKVDSILE